MMSPDMIAYETRKSTRKAKRHKSVPYVFSDSELADMNGGDVNAFKHIPLLGNHVPNGWTLVRSHFVDATGIGDESEPALTQKAMAKIINENGNHGWGLGEWGQFQVYINEYARTR